MPTRQEIERIFVSTSEALNYSQLIIDTEVKVSEWPTTIDFGDAAHRLHVAEGYAILANQLHRANESVREAVAPVKDIVLSVAASSECAHSVAASFAGNVAFVFRRGWDEPFEAVLIADQLEWLQDELAKVERVNQAALNQRMLVEKARAIEKIESASGIEKEADMGVADTERQRILEPLLAKLSRRRANSLRYLWENRETTVGDITLNVYGASGAQPRSVKEEIGRLNGDCLTHRQPQHPGISINQDREKVTLKILNNP